MTGNDGNAFEETVTHMDPQTIGVIADLLKAGPSVVLAVVCWYLWKEVQKERSDHMNTLRTQITDKAATIKDYQIFSDVLRQLTEVVKKTDDKQ